MLKGVFLDYKTNEIQKVVTIEVMVIVILERIKMIMSGTGYLQEFQFLFHHLHNNSNSVIKVGHFLFGKIINRGS